MGRFWDIHAFAAGAALAACLTGGAAPAQVSAAEETALRGEQQQQFAAMFEAPDDVDLMFQYALTSIRLQDHEAAMTTLERILIYSPNLLRVKVELGAS
jgi:thioredoxin-like negative regulator of GroEL